MREGRSLIVLAALVLGGCSTDDTVLSALRVPAPVTITALQPLSRNPLGVAVQHGMTDRYQIRARCVSSDYSENLVTPWQGADSSIVVLGLKPGEAYSVQVELLYDGRAIGGPSVAYSTPSLPPALRG